MNWICLYLIIEYLYLFIYVLLTATQTIHGEKMLYIKKFIRKI